jgi:hypothetical protein
VKDMVAFQYRPKHHLTFGAHVKVTVETLFRFHGDHFFVLIHKIQVDNTFGASLEAKVRQEWQSPD